MIRLAGTRILGALAQILLVTLLAWLLFYVIAKFTGASPAQRIAGKTASPAQIALVAKSLGLDQPYWRQYLVFLGRLVRGNFGFSYVQSRPVSQILWPALRATASLVLGAAVVWLAIAVPIGSYGGLRPRSAGDVAGRVIAILGMSIPAFTRLHVVISLVGIASGLVVLVGLFLIVGPGPMAFSKGRKVELADYHEVNPSGVPAALAQASLIKKGEYLAKAADCLVCHTATGGEAYAGGFAFVLPFGTLYSTNITPDKATGI